jgi:hypothetical protein
MSAFALSLKALMPNPTRLLTAAANGRNNGRGFWQLESAKYLGPQRIGPKAK